MKSLACKDMGMDCPFVAKGATAEEVINKGMAHGEKVHGEKMKEMMKMMSELEMKDMIMSKMKDE